MVFNILLLLSMFITYFIPARHSLQLKTACGNDTEFAKNHYPLWSLCVMEGVAIYQAGKYVYIGIKSYHEFKDELDVHKDVPQKTLHFMYCFVLQGLLSTAILILTLLTFESEAIQGPAWIITVFNVVPPLRVHKETFKDDEEYSRTTTLTRGTLSNDILNVTDDVEAAKEKERIKEWNA